MIYGVQVMNSVIANLKGSASMELMQMANRLKAEGKDIINLAGGEPDFSTPQRISEALFQSIRNGDTHYAVGTGISELKERIARKIFDDNRITANPDQVIVTPGSKYAIYLSIATLINPGDEVVVLNPSWVSYAPMIEACRGKAVSVELSADNNFAITEECLIPALSEKTKAIIINFPNNPTGKVLSEADSLVLQKILDKYDLYIISDEIYEKIIYDAFLHIAPGSWNDYSDRVITVNGFSKSYAMTGWRIGYLVASKKITEAMSKLFAHTITGIPPFVQKAACIAFDCEKEVEEMVAEYQSRRNYFVSNLNEVPFFSCNYPEGSFYAWVKVDSEYDSFAFSKILLEKTGIVGVPGQAYGATEHPFIRFSFANSRDALEESIGRLKQF